MILIPQYRTARRASAAAATLAFIGSHQDTTDLTTYTFASVSIGDAASNRYVIVAVHGRGSASRSLLSATIDGSAATIVSQQSWNNQFAAIIIGSVPSGTTTTVTVTASAGITRCGIGVYRAAGISATPTATGQDNSDPPSLAMSVVANGIILSAYTGLTSSPVWSGAAGDYVLAPETVQMTARGSTTPTTTTKTEELSTYTAGFAFCSAAWGP